MYFILFKWNVSLLTRPLKIKFESRAACINVKFIRIF